MFTLNFKVSTAWAAKLNFFERKTKLLRWERLEEINSQKSSHIEEVLSKNGNGTLTI